MQVPDKADQAYDGDDEDDEDRGKYVVALGFFFLIDASGFSIFRRLLALSGEVDR